MEKGALIGAGRTADVYAWGEQHILKLYQAWMPAVAIEREAAITCQARSAGLPVPATDELVKVDGRLGIVFERIQGTSLLKVLETRPWKFVPVARLLAEIHARMHACSLPPGSESQRTQIEQGIAWANDLTETEKHTILGILKDLPDASAVCHGDFHPDNILMASSGPVIIDWMTGRSGHPLADVARTVLLIRMGGLPPRVSLSTRLMINTSRVLLASIYLQRYRQVHPAAQSEIDAWQVPLLAARLFEVENYPQEKKAILEQIRSRLAKMKN